MKLINKQGKFYPHFVLALIVLIVAVLIVESSYPHMMKDNPIGHFDKVTHFVTFGLIASLCAYLLNVCGYGKSWKVFVVSALATVLVGGTNEYVQSFTQGRHAGLDDLLADVLGAFVFLTIWKIRGSEKLLDKKEAHS